MNSGFWATLYSNKELILKNSVKKIRSPTIFDSIYLPIVKFYNNVLLELFRYTMKIKIIKIILIFVKINPKSDRNLLNKN
ncbi:hypothetical protein BpHYR1_018951 [Brachionus plicatilis]|uniref:Uncharacterized protein n=1 Tax=Brachionus plicatilis TaxID=10195 RepID=A0A3M7PUJ8_BRAPC|nr:hypothetical protein BpHYR1_018951 [Brachionus plicatilis]